MPTDRRLNRVVMAAALGALALGAAGPTYAEDVGEMVGGAMQQPFRDLNIIREETPAVIVRAGEAPYAVESPGDCAALSTEIVALDGALGADVDAPVVKTGSAASQLASGALRSAVDLPFSGIVRRVTGAHSAQVARERAVLAAMVRRGYLKGLASARGCEVSVTTTAMAD